MWRCSLCLYWTHVHLETLSWSSGKAEALSFSPHSHHHHHFCWLSLLKMISNSVCRAASGRCCRLRCVWGSSLRQWWCHASICIPSDWIVHLFSHHHVFTQNQSLRPSAALQTRHSSSFRNLTLMLSLVKTERFIYLTVTSRKHGVRHEQQQPVFQNLILLCSFSLLWRICCFHFRGHTGFKAVMCPLCKIMYSFLIQKLLYVVRFFIGDLKYSVLFPWFCTVNNAVD